MHLRTTAAALLLLTLAACQPQAEPAAPPAAKAEPAAPAVPPAPPPPAMEAPAATTGPDSWIGKWAGPEGSFMDVEKSDSGYQLTISDVDGLKFFSGKRAGDAIEFERKGKTESIKAGDGKATGMKGLADKTNCLAIHAGEGFCRQ